MGGLAIGGFVAGRIADRVLRPLRWYGFLEIGIGLYAALFPVLLTIVTPVYLALWRALEPGPVMYGLIAVRPRGGGPGVADRDDGRDVAAPRAVRDPQARRSRRPDLDFCTR